MTQERKPDRKTPYVTVNVTPEARELLRLAAVELTSPAGRRVSMSEALIAAVHVGQNHPQEFVGEVTRAVG